MLQPAALRCAQTPCISYSQPHLYSAAGPPSAKIALSTSSIPGAAEAAAALPPPPPPAAAAAAAALPPLAAAAAPPPTLPPAAAAAAAAASCVGPAICIRRDTVSSGNATIWPLQAATTPQARLAPISGSLWCALLYARFSRSCSLQRARQHRQQECSGSETEMRKACTVVLGVLCVVCFDARTL